MFSGKSEELIRRLVRADIARQRVVAAKPAIDRRYSSTAIASHAGRQWKCAAINDSEEITALAHEIDADVIGIEEAQFFAMDLVRVVRTLVSEGRRVICAGLDLDAFARPFGPMPDLICEAEHLSKLSAVCVRCGADAYRSQLLVDGVPAPWQDSSVINVGGAETYEARCRSCFTVPGHPEL
jgi:thymidine kinase